MIYLFCCHFCLCLSFCRVESIYTLYGCSVLWHVCIDVESKQHCSRAGPAIGKRALSAQLTQGTPTPSTDTVHTPQTQKGQTPSTQHHQHRLLLHPGVHQDHSSWAATELHGEPGKSCLNPCQWKLPSSVSLCIFWKVCAWCLTLWSWYGWDTHLGSSSDFYFPIFKERYYLITPEN